jgi:aminodeoxyfutalosine synthase
MSKAQIQARVREVVTEDIREVHVVGGHNPEVGYAYFVDTIRWIKEVRPLVHVKAYTMAEIFFFSRISGKTVEAVVADLKAAGLDACTGGGAEILGERVRKKIVRGKVDGAGWLDTARRSRMSEVELHHVYGHVERAEDRVEHLSAPRTAGRDGRVPGFHPLASTTRNIVPEAGSSLPSRT